MDLYRIDHSKLHDTRRVIRFRTYNAVLNSKVCTSLPKKNCRNKQYIRINSDREIYNETCGLHIALIVGTIIS